MKLPAAILTIALLPSLHRAEPQQPDIKPDIVYGHKMGMALTFDVLTPKSGANGAGILFMVSGGWVSMWVPPEQLLGGLGKGLGFPALLEKGFTLFIVRHGSSPLFRVPDCIADVRLAVRFIRSHAANYGVDPARLGVFGASAGGHLSLMLGTTGEDSGHLAAVVAIFPPTELKSYLESDKMRTQFPALQFDAATWKAVSPLEHVTADDTPSLLLHGDKDTLVPDKHSREILQAFKDKNVPAELLMFPGAGHGFNKDQQAKAVSATVAWFEKYLAKPAVPDAAAPPK
ncbi:MAG: prolyl oligopeptidase family serine peptidase [Verrucomicrobiales bacterium]|nr:prolyl oligopeptidase family serine peptidase [Verrucomicrobiales bacterium]